MTMETDEAAEESREWPVTTGLMAYTFLAYAREGIVSVQQLLDEVRRTDDVTAGDLAIVSRLLVLLTDVELQLSHHLEGSKP